MLVKCDSNLQPKYPKMVQFANQLKAGECPGLREAQHRRIYLRMVPPWVHASVGLCGCVCVRTHILGLGVYMCVWMYVHVCMCA